MVKYYQIPKMCCNNRLTKVMAIQQLAPRINGFPPVFTSFTISLFRPIASIAITIKNLLISFNGTNMLGSAPKIVAIVVMMDAIMKNPINVGNALFKLNPSFSLRPKFSFASSFLPTIYDNARVIGIIASVLVSLTVAALSRVEDPSPHILSHVAAAAVTEDVSFIAVPANIPNASPLTVENPRILPRIGNIIAAITLKKNIIEIDCATSSSFAPMTGAVAAIAEPPQMDDPTPMRIAEFLSIFIAFIIMYATISAMDIVPIIIGSDCIPVWIITLKLRPNPKNTTAS